MVVQQSGFLTPPRSTLPAMTRPRQTLHMAHNGSRRPCRPLPVAAPISPLACEIVGALKVLSRPVPLQALALALSRSEAAIRAELGRLGANGYVVRHDGGGVALERHPGQIRLCAVCHHPLRRSNPDPEGICDPCRLGQREVAAQQAERFADEHHLRLMVLIRLAVQWGEPVDLAVYFETTDRVRIYRVVQWWRERGAVINGMPSGGYKIVDWRDESTAGTR